MIIFKIYIRITKVECSKTEPPK